MDRRTVLAGLSGIGVVSLSGCSRFRSVTDPATDERTITVESVDDTPQEHAVSIDVSMLHESVTAEQPARLRVTTTNTGRRRAISISQGRCSLFERWDGGSDDPPGLWLYDPDAASRIDRVDERWVADRPRDEPRVFPDYGCVPRDYDAGEAVTNRYVVWDDYAVAGYLSPGTYRWRQEVRVSESGSHGDEELGSFHWGFSLVVEAP